MFHYSEYLHQIVNLKICNIWPDFHGIFTKLDIGNIIHHFGKFLLKFNRVRANIWPQLGIWKSLHWHLKEGWAISVQEPLMTTAFAQRPLCAHAEVLLPCRRPYCAAMATIRLPNCALLEHHGNAKPQRLFWACSKCALSVGALCDPTASTCDAIALLRRCLRSYCAHLGVLHFSCTP